MTKKVVNLDEFDALSKKLKLQILYKNGVHVGKRVIDNYNAILFQLHGFYVEVHYKEYRKEVSQIITSNDSEILQPYLDQIYIRDLDADSKQDEGH